MKAKDYAQKFRAAGSTVEMLGKIIDDFINEIQSLRDARNAKKNEAIFSIFDEVCKKWEAFAKLAGNLDDGREIREDGFKEVMKRHFPTSFILWQTSKSRR